MKPILRLTAALTLTLIALASRADVTVVEYRHSGFDHYFITPVAAEIALLDTKAPPFQLWSRTGFTFSAYDSKAAPAGSVAICRFFNSSFAPKSSHFYAPKGLGCESTLANYPDWGLEDDQLFASMLPDATGSCPAGTVPVYRLYNSGLTGAPNHRFVTTLAERQAMLDLGYLAEGSGIGVGMCVVSVGAGRTTAEGLWRGTTDKGQALRILVLPDGKFYVVYSAPGDPTDAGALYGSGKAAAGRFTSTDAADYWFSISGSTFVGGASPINGTFVPRESLKLTIGSSSVSATYDDAYDTPVSLASLAGNYSINTGHITENFLAGGSIDTEGHLTIKGVECDFNITLTPRTGHVFDASIAVSRGPCPPLPAIVIYDSAVRKFYLMFQFYNGLLKFEDLFHLIGTRQ